MAVTYELCFQLFCSSFVAEPHVGKVFGGLLKDDINRIPVHVYYRHKGIPLFGIYFVQDDIGNLEMRMVDHGFYLSVGWVTIKREESRPTYQASLEVLSAKLLPCYWRHLLIQFVHAAPSQPHHRGLADHSPGQRTPRNRPTLYGLALRTICAAHGFLDFLPHSCLRTV